MKNLNLTIVSLIENDDGNVHLQHTLPHMSQQMPDHSTKTSIFGKLVSRLKAYAQHQKDLSEIANLSTQIKSDIGLTDAGAQRLSGESHEINSHDFILKYDE